MGSEDAGAVAASEPVVRPARSADAEALARVWIDAARYYAKLDPARFQVPEMTPAVSAFRESINAPPTAHKVLLVAEVRGRVTGLVSAHVEHPITNARVQLLRDLSTTRLFIDAVAVAEVDRRSGIGTRLIHAAEEWGRGQGASLVLLDTYVESPISLPFFE
jgi:GNAT superfamily N-acetyltransferase